MTPFRKGTHRIVTTIRATNDLKPPVYEGVSCALLFFRVIWWDRFHYPCLTNDEIEKIEES